jgi:branched-chain amino acid transport system substrate-binding protein
MCSGISSLPQMQVQSLVSFAVEELGARRFAVLYPDENYGRRYMNLFWDQVVNMGVWLTALRCMIPMARISPNP